MDQTIQAVFEHGILRPLSPVALDEQQVVSVTISIPKSAGPIASTADLKGEKQRQVILQYVKDMERLPDKSPQDGLTNRDHDQILYGPQT